MAPPNVDRVLASDQQTFRVRVFFLLQKELRERILSDSAQIKQRVLLEGYNETLTIDTKSFETEDDVRTELKLVETRTEPATIILVSDRLIQRDPEGRPLRDAKGKVAPGSMVDEIRRKFLISKVLLGMVGLHEGPVRHVRDIDRMLSVDELTLQKLREAVVNTAFGLRMKAPPPERRKIPEQESIRIEVVQSEAQLRECFTVRHRVYGEILRYLPDEMIAHPAKIELDYFDTNSIHFAAVREPAEKVIGTTRLVLNYPSGKTAWVGGSGAFPPFTLTEHSAWCNNIARRAGKPFGARVKNAPGNFAGVFPILLSTDFRRNQRQVIDEALYGSELSRLVLLPAFRGYHVSSMLVKAAIAKASQLARRTVLLECIPKHVGMYSKYGFKRLDGAPHSRPSDLDQYAIGMRLALTQNDVENRARLYLNTILEGRTEFHFLRFGPFEVPESQEQAPSVYGEEEDSGLTYPLR